MKRFVEGTDRGQSTVTCPSVAAEPDPDIRR